MGLGSRREDRRDPTPRELEARAHPYLEVDRRRSLGQIASVVLPYLGVWVLAISIEPSAPVAIALGLVATVSPRIAGGSASPRASRRGRDQHDDRRGVREFLPPAAVRIPPLPQPGAAAAGGSKPGLPVRAPLPAAGHDPNHPAQRGADEPRAGVLGRGLECPRRAGNVPVPFPPVRGASSDRSDRIAPLGETPVLAAGQREAADQLGP